MPSPSDRSAIGGSGDNTKNVHYNTSPAAIGGQINNGDEFVLLVRSRQSEGFQLWSSNDKSATPQLVQEAMRQFDLETTSA